jgi:hypothetical protein
MVEPTPVGPKLVRLMLVEEYQGEYRVFGELDQAGQWRMASGSIKRLDKDLRSIGQIFECHLAAVVIFSRECKKDQDKKKPGSEIRREHSRFGEEE